jgi:hypothetical protein
MGQGQIDIRQLLKTLFVHEFSRMDTNFFRDNSCQFVDEKELLEVPY